MNPLYRLTPHARQSRSPLFAAETRHIPWGYDASALIRSSLRWLLTVCAVLLSLWLLSALVSPDRWLDETGLDITTWALGLSLLAFPLLDFMSVSAALRSVNGDIAAGRWDVLRLTSLTTLQIVSAKHAAAQVRVWRVMMLIISVRIAGTFMLAVIVLLRTVSDPYGLRADPRALSDAIVLIIVPGATLLVFIVEPLWRIRALTALGVAISARASDHTSALLVALGTMLLFWLAQIVFFLALIVAATSVTAPLLLLGLSLGFIDLVLLAFPLILAVGIYGSLSTLERWALRRAERSIIRLP